LQEYGLDLCPPCPKQHMRDQRILPRSPMGSGRGRALLSSGPRYVRLFGDNSIKPRRNKPRIQRVRRRSPAHSHCHLQPLCPYHLAGSKPTRCARGSGQRYGGPSSPPFGPPSSPSAMLSSKPLRPSSTTAAPALYLAGLSPFPFSLPSLHPSSGHTFTCR